MSCTITAPKLDSAWVTAYLEFNEPAGQLPDSRSHVRNVARANGRAKESKQLANISASQAIDQGVQLPYFMFPRNDTDLIRASQRRRAAFLPRAILASARA